MAEFINIDSWADKYNFAGGDFDSVIKSLNSGELIAFPTDTVYGLGCNIEDEGAVSKIFEIKKRSSNKALGAYLGEENCRDKIKQISDDIPDIFYKLSEIFLPGPLTLIIPRHKNFARLATSNSKGIAVRIPNHKPLLSFLPKYQGILSGTSLNLSGKPPINNPNEIQKIFGSDIKYILTSNQKFSAISSTVIDLTQNKVKLLREGDISWSEIRKFI
jgi:L-threonylcarbamoyladenylate synthase